ncbi:hypothetical protein J2Z69_000281 [Paenibacillus shirakamiensis]|uniref:Uncharacterized protein n=1 Tax=Paenibacillus shirakamiensis TaxID=1265935 RepID=A0ABS4JC23_9BACL|nr:hypothetical protein [Paenibacillus shirakamiensis]MBP1999262.1 hypothetical protein [Paenibacillus shirakamiensis]
MGTADMVNLEKWLPLAEKYGLSVVLSFILLLFVGMVVRMIVRGDLVPRSMLERAEEDRDRLQAILDREREGFMNPLLDMVKHLKQDYTSKND